MTCLYEKRTPFGVLFSFYLNLIHEQPPWIAVAIVIRRQFEAFNHNLDITCGYRLKLQLVCQNAILILPCAKRENTITGICKCIYKFILVVIEEICIYMVISDFCNKGSFLIEIFCISII